MELWFAHHDAYCSLMSQPIQMCVCSCVCVHINDVLLSSIFFLHENFQNKQQHTDAQARSKLLNRWQNGEFFFYIIVNVLNIKMHTIYKMYWILGQFTLECVHYKCFYVFFVCQMFEGMNSYATKFEIFYFKWHKQFALF